MTYKINGVEFPLQPSTGNWIEREAKGFDGEGRPIYVAPREFEIRWGIQDPSGTFTLQQWFEEVSTTGTAVVTLPQYRAAEYVFYDYSGCTLGEPAAGEYFAKNETDIVLIVYNIRTT